MSPWRILERELDHWAESGRTATLWWRDDDAAHPAPALDRLLNLRAAAGAPLALAVIPAAVDDDIPVRLAARDGIDVLQHGFAHRNHAGPGARKSELGSERPLAAVLEELAAGQERLAALFGDRFLPVMVPPWNRLAETVAEALPAHGFEGVSVFGPRPRLGPVAGLAEVNTHADIIRWRGGRDFLGTEESLAPMVAHLRSRRSGDAEADEPTGLLTHHLAHDEGCWGFIGRLLERTRAHPGARWIAATDVFPRRRK